MKYHKTAFVLVSLMLVLIVADVNAGREKEIIKTFDNKEIVEINTVSGDCVVTKGNTEKIEVHLVYESKRWLYFNQHGIVLRWKPETGEDYEMFGWHNLKRINQ